jgi:hypothetical protein
VSLAAEHDLLVVLPTTANMLSAVASRGRTRPPGGHRPPRGLPGGVLPGAERGDLEQTGPPTDRGALARRRLRGRRPDLEIAIRRQPRLRRLRSDAAGAAAVRGAGPLPPGRVGTGHIRRRFVGGVPGADRRSHGGNGRSSPGGKVFVFGRTGLPPLCPVSRPGAFAGDAGGGGASHTGRARHPPHRRQLSPHRAGGDGRGDGHGVGFAREFAYGVHERTLAPSRPSG